MTTENDTFSLAQYQTQLNTKIDKYQQTLADFELSNVVVFPSQPLGFRMRAEFRIWHEDGRAHYAMNRPGEKRPHIIDQFPIGGPLITQQMTPLLATINLSQALSQKLFSLEFLTTTSGQTLITLIYHRRLDEAWETAARELQNKLSVMVIGRSKKQKIVLDSDFVTETLQIDDRQYSYQQVESGFTQPNAAVNVHMLTWASQCLKGSRGDLVELYCGNGNFTAVLAQHFDQVLATEISKVSVRSAHTNFLSNNIENVSVVRMSSEELTQALNKERPFRRLAEIDLASYDFTTIFVDPPRAGLDEETLKLVSRFDNILYISCNPETLAANLRQICTTHQIESVAAFDQFPWTTHLESGVLLKRKTD